MSVAGIWPFWSQQDKFTQLFRVDTCGNAKQLAYLAKALNDAKVGVRVAVPDNYVGSHNFRNYIHVKLPISNPEQRIHWDVQQLKSFFASVDIAILNNEYMAYPVRQLFPKLKIVQMCPVPIDNPMFKLAFDSADLVTTRSVVSANDVRIRTLTPVSVWPMYYDDSQFVGYVPLKRDIDVLFLPRCSANNATHHVEFMEAVKGTKWRVVFTDVTRYLQTLQLNVECSEPADYIQTLHASRVVVSLYDNWNGEMGLYEALRAGCTPVVRRTWGNVQLLGELYPYFVDNLTDLRSVIEQALRHSKPYDAVPLERIRAGSYQEGSKQAVEDVCRLLR